MPVYRAPILCLAALAPIVLAAKVVFPSVLPVPVSVFKAIQEQKFALHFLLLAKLAS